MPIHKRNLYILSLTIFLAAISWNQVMPFLSKFLQQMGVSEENLMFWVYGAFILQSISAIVAQPLWGKLGDRYGQKPMIIRAGICLTLIYLGMSYCVAPWQIALLRFLNGALTGFIPGSIALIATNSPAHEAPKAVATAQTACAAGQIIGPAVGGVLADLLGYRGSMQISGAAVMLSTLLVIVFVKEATKARVAETTSLIQDIKMSIGSPVLASIMLVSVVIGIFGNAIYPVLAVHLSNISSGKMSDLVTGIIFSLPPAAFLITARIWTEMGARNSYSAIIQIGLIGSAICALLLALINSIWLFSVTFFIAGLFLASVSPSTAALIAVKVQSGFHGRAYGIQQSAVTVGALIAFIFASIVGGKYGPAAIFTFIGISFVVGAVLFPITVRRWGSRSGEIDV
ncbi:MAG: MFS transporter [Armatimonadota bacterium]